MLCRDITRSPATWFRYLVDEQPAPALAAPALAVEGNATAATSKAPPPRRRPTAMSARPGEFKLGYDWRELMPDQEVPRGCEIMASLEEVSERAFPCQTQPQYIHRYR
jgi:hypothetical protein